MQTTDSITIRIATLLSFMVIANVAKSENMGFLPGDAFFHSTLSFSQIEEAAKSKVVALDYFTPTEGSFSGHAGYFRLDLQIDNDAFLANLHSAYDWMRFRSPRENFVKWKYSDKGDRIVKSRQSEEVESNPFRVFVYNKSLEIESIRLGVKYNENWKSEAMPFRRYDTGRTLLDEFSKCYECVSESWENSGQVSPLKAPLPKVQIEKGKGINDPIVCPASEYAVVMMLGHDYKRLFSRDRGEQIIIVTAVDTQYYIAESDKWVRKEILRIVQE